VSGHDEAAFEAATRGVSPNHVTLVVLMGVRKSAQIAWSLINAGWSRHTPAAIVADAWTSNQHVWQGTLDGLSEERATIPDRSAGTIVIGDVVALGVFAEGQEIDRSADAARSSRQFG